MCGIAGYLDTSSAAPDTAILDRMIDRIRYRGPDDRGVWTGEAVGLAHARLSILDLSDRGHQPFLTPDGTGVLSYNGEIYNFRELRRRLEAEGVRFTSATDTEVLLHALHRWGVKTAVRELDGMFAFAYLDRRGGTLWLGRDRAGIKPLYLFEAPGLVAFASEIKALLAHPAVPGRPDLHALTTHVVKARLTGTWTPFEDVESVLPGTVVEIDPSGNRRTHTWFDVLRDTDPRRIARGKEEPFEGACDRFERIFTDSVRAHLVSDAPLATMCSGGLDSSLITAIARRSKPDIVAYVAVVEGTPVPEVQRAEKVCSHLGVELRHVPIDREGFLRLLPHVVLHNDQPAYFPQNVASMAIARAARRDGFKVLLAGGGSDELFGGYGWQVETYRMWRLRRLHRRVIPDTKLVRWIGSRLARLEPLDLDDLARRPFEHLNTPEGLRRKNAGRAVAVDGVQRDVRSAALFRMLEPAGPLEERAFLARSFEDVYIHLRTSLTANDKMGMSTSVEIRFPFLGREVVDFGLHLPCAYKYHPPRRFRRGGGTTKRIVKAVGERYLPRDIVHAPKVGFGTAPDTWMGALDMLRDGYAAGIFKWGGREQAEIDRRIRDHESVAFHLLALELWGRLYVRGEDPDALAEQLLTLAGDATPGAGRAPAAAARRGVAEPEGAR